MFQHNLGNGDTNAISTLAKNNQKEEAFELPRLKASALLITPKEFQQRPQDGHRYLQQTQMEQVIRTDSVEDGAGHRPLNSNRSGYF